MKPRLVLFTSNYPFVHTGGETMFVAPELPCLVDKFDQVLVVPLYDTGKELPLPRSAVVNRSLAEKWKRRKLWYYLLAPSWPGFLRELYRGLFTGGGIGIARVWRWAAVAVATWHWFKRESVGKDRTALLYTYWRGGQTLAAVRYAASRRNLRVVTRVHGYDLYAEAFARPFQPWLTVYKALDLILTVSNHATDYLRKSGVDVNRISLARLGVDAQKRPAPPSRDGVIRIVSCSNVIPIKRVDFTAQVLCALASSRPRQRFIWTHFGDGSDMPLVERSIMSAPGNLTVDLKGRVPNSTVRSYYANESVDAFVLLSQSEGLPVSIQEALAAGIPVFATDVGGVREALYGEDTGGGGGTSVSVEATVEVVADALGQFLLRPSVEEIRLDRERARRRWQLDFNSAQNHSRLAERLLILVQGTAPMNDDI